jgi:hypothetical protein
MRIAVAAFTVANDTPFAWRADWGWGLPLIVLTVLIHVSGLWVISQRVIHANVSRVSERSHPRVAFVVVLGATTLLATCLHGIDAAVWAFAYLFLGALPDYRSSVLYSLNAITSYGHTNLALEDHWHLLGAMESLNGWLLFGLTTAFLFAVLEKVWSVGAAKEHR